MEALALSVLPIYSPTPRSFTSTIFKTPLLDHSKFKEAAMHGNLIPVYKPIFSGHLNHVLAYRCLAKEDDRDVPSFLFDEDAAEVAYEEVIEAEPENSHYQAEYAFSLHRTGGERTCYLLREDDKNAPSFLSESVVPGPKSSTKVDAESLNKFASSMGMVRNDEDRAELAYLEAIEAEPENKQLLADYALFLLRISNEKIYHLPSSLDSD